MFLIHVSDTHRPGIHVPFPVVMFEVFSHDTHAMWAIENKKEVGKETKLERKCHKFLISFRLYLYVHIGNAMVKKLNSKTTSSEHLRCSELGVYHGITYLIMYSILKVIYF